MISNIQVSIPQNYVYTLNKEGKIVDKKESVSQDYVYTLNKGAVTNQLKAGKSLFQ